MISCIGVLPDVNQVVTYDFKRPETTLMLIGERKDECGGSVYYQLQHELGANLPKPDLTIFAKEIHTLHSAIQQKLVLSAHDISEGGVAVALAEMSFKNNLGVEITVPGDLSTEKKLFGETGGFVLEVARDKVKDIKKLFEEQHLSLFVLGETTLEPRLRMNGVLDVPIQDAKHAWEHGLREKLV
jgi:phosphoribosylformylglycinamidine synthase